MIVTGGVIPVREHFADFGLTWGPRPRDVDGPEYQITLAEVFAGVEVHIGEETMIAKLVEPGFGVDEIGVGNKFEAILTCPIARLCQEQRLRQDGCEMQTVP